MAIHDAARRRRNGRIFGAAVRADVRSTGRCRHALRAQGRGPERTRRRGLPRDPRLSVASAAGRCGHLAAVRGELADAAPSMGRIRARARRSAQDEFRVPAVVRACDKRRRVSRYRQRDPVCATARRVSRRPAVHTAASSYVPRRLMEFTRGCSRASTSTAAASRWVSCIWNGYGIPRGEGGRWKIF